MYNTELSSVLYITGNCFVYKNNLNYEMKLLKNLAQNIKLESARTHKQKKLITEYFEAIVN